MGSATPSESILLRSVIKFLCNGLGPVLIKCYMELCV